MRMMSSLSRNVFFSIREIKFKDFQEIEFQAGCEQLAQAAFGCTCFISVCVTETSRSVLI